MHSAYRVRLVLERKKLQPKKVFFFNFSSSRLKTSSSALVGHFEFESTIESAHPAADPKPRAVASLRRT